MPPLHRRDSWSEIRGAQALLSLDAALSRCNTTPRPRLGEVRVDVASKNALGRQPLGASSIFRTAQLPAAQLPAVQVPAEPLPAVPLSAVRGGGVRERSSLHSCVGPWSPVSPAGG